MLQRFVEGHQTDFKAHAVRPLRHCIPVSLTYSVTLLLKRHCDRTLGRRGRGGRGGGRGGSGRPDGASVPTGASGGARDRSHCRFVLSLIHFIPYLRTYSVHLFLK